MGEDMAKLAYLYFLLTFVFSCQLTTKNNEVDDVSEAFWGEAGAIGYVKGYNKMIVNHPDYVSLTILEKRVLYPIFGSLVDDIKIHWNSVPLNRWASDQYGIDLVGEEAVAQCYGYDVFIKNDKKSYTEEQLLEIYIHEITHSLQYKDLGEDLKKFGDAYFRNYYLAGQSYRGNAYEEEANEMVKLWLDTSIKSYQNAN
jgi:hypothetical protein